MSTPQASLRALPSKSLPRALPACAARLRGKGKARPAGPRESAAQRSLSRAFESFQIAARSLEKSYGHLQAEVLRLRFELERTNRDLAVSVEENARMRLYLARVLEGLPCGVVVTNSAGEILMVNPEARRLLSTAVAPESAGEVNSLFRSILAGLHESAGLGRLEREWIPPGPGENRTLGLACAVLGENAGQGAAAESVFLLRDVTEEKKRAARDESARRRESLAEMATLLAHEIRNPLGSLELFAGLLADAAAAQPDLRRWTDHIQAVLRLLSSTVNNVLQYHSQPEPQLTSINLGRLVRESVEFLRPLARQSGLRIDLHNALGELEIPADAHRLQQVFFNLAVNAFRSMTMGGTLSIRIAWEDVRTFDSVQLEFEDTGCGIPAEHLPKLFEPGFTLHLGNPGLGLAVCRTVVEQHRGNIRVKSEPGIGTTFTLTLPRERGEG